MDASESKEWDSCPSLFGVLSKGANLAHLSVQTQQSPLSIKEPLRSARLATGCHCYSTHTVASELFRQGLDLDGTWAPLHLTYHRIVIPPGVTPQANSMFPVKATSLSHCLSIPIVLPQRRKKRERHEKKKRTSLVPHFTGSPRVGLWTFITLDKPMSFNKS